MLLAGHVILLTADVADSVVFSDRDARLDYGWCVDRRSVVSHKTTSVVVPSPVIFCEET